VIFIQSAVNFDACGDPWHSRTPIECSRLSAMRLTALGSICFYGDAPAGVAYTFVEDVPQMLRSVGPRCWSLPKLYASSIQNGDFMHVDQDCFVSSPLPSVPFLVQGEEPNSTTNALAWFQGFHEFLSRCGLRWQLLDEAREQADKNGGPKLYNCGIFGGTSRLLPAVCREVIEFAVNNSDILNKLPLSVFVTAVLEQILIPLVMQARGVVLTELLQPGNQDEQARNIGYCHLVGRAKHDIRNIELVRNRIATLEVLTT